MTDSPTHAAVYVRVSTEEQATEGYGLDVQRARCLAMATVKGWSVDAAHIYADEGISGTKGPEERPALAELLAAVEAHTVDAVIVLALDRLGRRTKIVLDVVDRFRAANVELVSCKESLDTSTAQGRFVLQMFAALAELERETILQRTTDGRNERGKKDGEKGGRVPFGYRRRQLGGGVAVEPLEAGIVRAIFALRYDDDLPLREIAARLEAQGFAPPRGAKQWYASSLREILANEHAYRGGPRGESIVRWPAVLEEV